MARGFTARVWVPQSLVERLQLGFRGHTAAIPVGLDAENGRRFFYNLSQLECTQEKAEESVARLLSAASCTPAPQGPDAAVCPLNTNGEPFPPSFAEEVLLRFGERGLGATSRYWATVDEAEFIFNSPFEASFLREENAVALRLDGAAVCAKYYNVCGTCRPDVFNSYTCRPYHPVNFSGKPYCPIIATHMKASAIRHGCMSSRMWLTTRRAARIGVGIRRDMKPLTFLFEDTFHLINVAMTLNPQRIMDSSLSRAQNDLPDDDSLTEP